MVTWPRRSIKPSPGAKYRITEDILSGNKVSGGRGFNLFVYIFDALQPRCSLDVELCTLYFFAKRTHEFVFQNVA
jgi:hypothetical protein